MSASGEPTATDDDALLASIGIELESRRAGEVRAACAPIARRIASDNARVVGFVPSDSHVAVPPLLVHLGLSLCDLTGATVAVVDANVRYPGLTAIAGAQPAAGPTAAPRPDRDESVFTTRWLRGSLALLTPPRVERAGEVVPQLARVLLGGADLFAHVLVDLTGFDLLGEHATAAACMDAVALVGRAHRTRERELVELAALMPRGRFLGVMLAG